MENEIKQNDFTETLTPPSNSAHGNGMNVTVPIACSGNFIKWDQAGKLEKFVSLCMEAQEIRRRLQDIEKKLLACNVPATLIKMKQAWQREKRDFVKELISRTQRWEKQKEHLERRLLGIRLILIKEAPTLVPFAVQIVPQMSFPTKKRKGIRGGSSIVAGRNAIIDRYHADPVKVICKKLDLEFPRLEGPAKELPSTWTNRYGVTTFREAYMHIECRSLVHTLISKRKRRKARMVTV